VNWDAEGPVGKEQKRTEKEGKHVIKYGDDHTPCKFCGKCYDTKEDDKPLNDWLQCSVCQLWAYETCGEEEGVLADDDEFICKDCVAWSHLPELQQLI